MKLLPREILLNYDNIFNIHPALLPKYGGQGMYGDRVHQAVIKNKERESGATIHRVNACYDEGEIWISNKVPVYAHDSVEKLRERVHACEASLIIEFARNFERYFLG